MLSTSFLVMGLAAGCGVATNDAGNDRNRTNLTPVGYDTRTNFRPLNVTAPTTDDPTGATNDETTTETNNGTPGDTNTTGTETDNTGNDADDNQQTPGNGTATTPDVDNDTPGTNDATPDDNDVEPGKEDETPGADNTTGEKNETQTPVTGGNQAADFSDVPKTNWAHDDIHAARDLGLLSGIGNNKFGLGQAKKREEIASILMKAYRAGYMVGNNNNNETGTNTTGTNNTETNNTNTTGNNNTDVTGTTNNGGTIDTNGTDNTGLNAPNINTGT